MIDCQITARGDMVTLSGEIVAFMADYEVSATNWKVIVVGRSLREAAYVFDFIRRNETVPEEIFRSAVSIVGRYGEVFAVTSSDWQKLEGVCANRVLYVVSVGALESRVMEIIHGQLATCPPPVSRLILWA